MIVLVKIPLVDEQLPWNMTGNFDTPSHELSMAVVLMPKKISVLVPSGVGVGVGVGVGIEMGAGVGVGMGANTG